MNRFEVVIDPRQYVRWDATHGFQPVELRIDGVPLLELVRAVEERILAGEADPPEASRYLGLPANADLARDLMMPTPPEEFGFVIASDHFCVGGTIVLGCSCGITACWFLVVTIEVGDDTVRWSNIRQFHAEAWQYDLGPYVFERAAYERALREPIVIAP